MMKYEFETLIGKEIGIDDYEIIELVYTYHPIFECAKPKEKCSTLFNLGGMIIFRDMAETARSGLLYYQMINKKLREADGLKKLHDALIEDGIYRDFSEIEE